MKPMKYWNNSQPCTIPSEVLADTAFDSNGPRPERVTVPAYAVVDVKPEYGLRRRSDAGNDLPSIIHQLSGGRMVPHDDESKQLFATTYQHQLPHVMLEQAKHAVGNEGVSTAPEDKAARERKLNEEAGRRMRAALGEQEEAAKPKANPVFTLDER